MVRWKQRADNPFQPDNRHSGLPQRLCGNSISSRPGRKGMVPGTTMALMVAGGVTSIPAAMGVHALVRRDVFFSDLIFGLGAEFLAGYSFQLLVKLLMLI